MLGKIVIEFSLLYKTELILTVSQSAVSFLHKSHKSAQSRGEGGGGAYPLDMIFNRKGTPFVYLPLKSGTPVTYLLKNKLGPFFSQNKKR